jgi:hypothetical protein
MPWWMRLVMAVEELTAHDFDSPVSKAELEEALTYHAAAASRLPRHFVDKRAAIHRVINNLLDEWEHAGR